MGRLQKVTVIISVILVILLSGALGLFLWNESKEPLAAETEVQLGEEAGEAPKAQSEEIRDRKSVV